MKTDKADKAKLVEACLKRDPVACKQLYDSYAPQMLGICMRYARSRESAEDILHDGFIKVFESLHKLRDASQLDSWIRSLMVHTAISTFRHERFTENVADYDDEGNPFNESDLIYSQIDIKLIMEAIQQLPTAYRMAFNLCEVEGYEYEDAAAELGINESTVRSNLCRARRILAKKLVRYR